MIVKIVISLRKKIVEKELRIERNIEIFLKYTFFCFKNKYKTTFKNKKYNS